MIRTSSGDSEQQPEIPGVIIDVENNREYMITTTTRRIEKQLGLSHDPEGRIVTTQTTKKVKARPLRPETVEASM